MSSPTNLKTESPQVQTDYYRLKSNLGFHIVDDDVFISTETQSLHLRGKAYPILLPLFQNGVNLQELLANIPAGLTAREIAFSINHLAHHSLINNFKNPAIKRGEHNTNTIANSDIDDNIVFWDSLGINPSDALQRLRQATIHILDLTGNADMAALETRLAKQSIIIQENVDADTALQVVIVADYLETNLADVNRLNFERKIPWLLIKPTGELLWIGPLIIPVQTACWECISHRLKYRSKLKEYLAANNTDSASKPLQTSFSCSTDMAYAAACAEIIKFIAMRGEVIESTQVPTLDHILTINALNYHFDQHITVKRPQCPCCGRANWIKEQQSRPVSLTNSDPVSNREGGLRAKSSKQIFDQLKHHISPVIGLIGATNIINLNNDEQNITTSVAAEHNFSLIDSKSSFLQERIRSCAGGKGKTLIQAQAGALCESIERFSGVFQGDEKRISAAMSDLPNAIHPNECLLYSEKQFKNRDSLNASSTRMTWIPTPFDSTEIIEWTPLWSLTHHDFFYLPTSYCFYGYARLNNCEFAKADSNGCAAGSNIPEAVLQGFLELIERDAAAIWWYNRLNKSEVDLCSFNDPYLLAVKEYYARNNRKMWVLDITSDFEIPCFVALCAQVGMESEQITFAFGAHLDASIALVRAVSELNQIMPNVSLDPSITLKSLGTEAVDWWRDANLVNQPYLLPNDEPPRQLHDYPNRREIGLNEALTACIELALEKNLNLLVLDQTRPDTGLNVVKVVVPSLRHFWPRFGPGRLYSASGAASSEDNLNPYPIFI